MAIQTVSNVNPNFPVPLQDNAAQTLQNQFKTIKTELELIFGAVNAGVSLSAILTAISGITSTGTLQIDSTTAASTYPVTAYGKTLINTATAAAAQGILLLGSAALQPTSAFAATGHTHTVATLPPMVGATAGSPGQAGYVPTPAAGDNVRFLTGAATYTGLQGSVTGAIAGNYQLYSQASFDNTRFKFIDNGNSGAAKTIDISVAQFQRITLTSAAVTITVGTWGPTGTVLPMVLEVVQDGTGSRVPTFAGAAFKFTVGTAPTWSTAAGKKDIVCIYSTDGGTTANLSVAGFDFR